MALIPVKPSQVPLAYNSGSDVDITNDVLVIGSSASGGQVAKLSPTQLRDAIIPTAGQRYWAVDPGPGFGDEYSYTDDVVLTADQDGAVINNAGAAKAITITLPAAIAGMEFAIDRVAAFALTVQPDGSDTIDAGLPGIAYVINSDVLTAFTCYADTKWRISIGGNKSSFLDVRSFGADPTGTISSSSAIQAACTAAGVANLDVYVSVGTYLCSGVSVPNNVTIFGSGRNSVLQKNANGPVLTLNDKSRCRSLRINGVGGTYTGVGITIPATTQFNGYQRVTDCDIEDTESYGVKYSAKYAGYMSIISNCSIRPTSTSTYGVKWGEEALPSDHGNRSIIGCSFGISPIVDASGSQDGLVTGCYSGGTPVNAVLTDSISAKIIVTGNRLIASNQTINGTSCAFTGNVIDGSITLGATAAQCSVTGNSLTNITLTAGASQCTAQANTVTGTITDNSGVTSNMVDMPRTSYTPVWSSSGTQPALGDGTIGGYFTRSGRSVTANIFLNIGATTTFGTGNYYFSLPFATTILAGGVAKILDSGTAHYLGYVTTVADGTARCQVYGQNATTGINILTPTVPMTWAPNDSLLINLTYEI